VNPRFVSPILAAALLGGACSSSDGSAATSSTAAASAPDSRPDSTRPSTTVGVQDSSTAPSSTSTPPATTAPAPSTTPATTEAPPTTADGPETTDPAEGEFTDAEAIDRSDARTALITLSVFPDDWIEDPIEVDGDDDPGTDEFEAEFDACLGRDDDDQVGDELDRLKVSTGDFHPVENDTTTVSHEVVLAADVDTALAAMAEVRVDGAEPCLADVIGDFYRTEFADDPELADVGIGEVIVTRTEDDSDPDLAVGVLLEVPLTIGDQTVSQFLELLYQRQGRALSELSFSSFGGQFDRDGYTVLSDEVIVRLAAIGN
jgi:hypothetical protein